MKYIYESLPIDIVEYAPDNILFNLWSEGWSMNDMHPLSAVCLLNKSADYYKPIKDIVLPKECLNIDYEKEKSTWRQVLYWASGGNSQWLCGMPTGRSRWDDIKRNNDIGYVHYPLHAYLKYNLTQDVIDELYEAVSEELSFMFDDYADFIELGMTTIEIESDMTVEQLLIEMEYWKYQFGSVDLYDWIDKIIGNTFFTVLKQRNLYDDYLIYTHKDNNQTALDFDDQQQKFTPLVQVELMNMFDTIL